jgi:hypothetical protein
MRQSSNLGVGIVALLASWCAVASVEGQQPFGPPSSGPPIKQGYVITPGAKEYEMLTDLTEIEGKFRSFDPDNSILKVRWEWVHAEKDHKDDYDRAVKAKQDQYKNFQNRYTTHQNDYRGALARARTQQDKNNVSNNYKNQMDSLANDKRNADNQFNDTVKNLGMVRDYIDYELLVSNGAPIRKMWAPKLFDDKGRVRTEMTKEERLKYKGPDSKLVGWVAKLEVFELHTPILVKLKLGGAGMKEPEPEPEPQSAPSSSATTPPPPPMPGVVGKDDPAAAKKEMKLEERPVVKMVIAERDLSETPAPKKK